jgi:hypothetical protein
MWRFTRLLVGHGGAVADRSAHRPGSQDDPQVLVGLGEPPRESWRR